MEKDSVDSVLTMLISIVSDETGIPPAVLSEKTRLDDLNIDSLDYLCLIQRIREELGPLSTKTAIEAGTIGAIAQALAA